MTSQSGSMVSGASEASVTGEPSGAAIDLYWLPLGAGGHFVRLNGRIYEAIPRIPRPPPSLRSVPLRAPGPCT